MSDQPEHRQNLFDNRYRYDFIYPRGRSGETLRAWDTHDNDRPVVIKRPAPQDAPPLRAAQQVSISSERKALERLSGHPIIAGLHATGTFKVGPQSYTYLVLERAEGLIIADLVLELAEQGLRLPELEMLVVVDRLLDLLTAAHEQQVVYNDVDAKHLFWDRDNYRLQVIDWGNAVLLDEGGGSSTINRQTDIYQVGELLYFIVTGGARLDSETMPDGEHVVLFGGATAHISATLQSIITRATHPNLRRRYISIADLRQALRDYRKPLETQRDALLSEVRREISHRKSKQEMEALALRLAEVLAQDPGFPETRRLQQQIQRALQRLDVEASIDAGRIYLTTANWSKAIEVMLALLKDADENIAPAIRFIIAAAEYLEAQERTEAPSVLAPAIDALLHNEPEQAGLALLSSPRELLPDTDQMILAERLAALVPSVILLRPHLVRIRTELNTLGAGKSEALSIVDRIEVTLNQSPPTFGLRGLQSIYRQIESDLGQLQTLADSSDDRQTPAGLRAAYSRADEALQRLNIALEQVSLFAYTDAIKAGQSLRAAITIDPLNPYFEQLNDYFDEIHQAIKALSTFKPRSDGADLSDWFTRVLNFLQPYGDDLQDPALHSALEALKKSSELWNEVQNNFSLGRQALVQKQLTHLKQLMQPLNAHIGDWMQTLVQSAISTAYVEKLSINTLLGQRLVEAYQTWDQGKFAQTVELAEQMTRLADTPAEKAAVERLQKLGDLCHRWIQNGGEADYDLTDKAEQAVIELFLAEENDERERFATQMPSTEVYLKTMTRGLVETLRTSSTAGLRLLFLHYIWRGMLYVQKDHLEDAQFWREAALKTIPKGRSNPIFAAFDRMFTGRQLVLQAQEALNSVHSPTDLIALRAMLNQPLADQWLADIQPEARQLELAIRHWEDGDFRAAAEMLNKALQQIEYAESHARMNLAPFRQWVEPLYEAAQELQAARLYVEQVAHAATVPNPNEPVDPQVEGALRMILQTTQTSLGDDYAHLTRQWLATYLAVLETHLNTQLGKSEKLAAFEGHFNNLFIGKHPAYRLFQVWQESAHKTPDAPPPPPLPIEPQLELQWVDAVPATSSTRSSARRAAVAEEVSETATFDLEEGIRYEEPRETAGIPWGTLIALTIVIVGVVLFVLFFGGLGEDGDDSPPSNSNNNVATTLTPLPTSTESSERVALGETPSPSVTATLAPASPVPVNTVTSSPSPPPASPTSTATVTVATLTPTGTSTVTPVPLVTTVITPVSSSPTSSVAETPIRVPGSAQDALLIFNLIQPEDYGWEEPDWFRPGAGGIWQLGAARTAGSGPVVVLMPPDFMQAVFGPQAAGSLVAIEAEMELSVFDENTVVFFGMGLQNERRQRTAAEIRLVGVEPNIINLGMNENGNFAGRSQRGIGIIKVVLRSERNADGTISHFVDNQRLGESGANYAPGTPLTPVLYTSSGGVYVVVTRLQFEFSAISQ